MEINNTKTKNSSFERKALLLLSVLFVATIAGAWLYSVNLSKNISAKNETINVDTRALIEVERIRNLAESQIDNSLSFFLLGASSLFEEQKKDKQNFLESLTSFEKQYSLEKVPELVKRIGTLEQQQQDIFDQAMDFRAKATESKIVGQFYRAKTTPIRNNINKALDDIVQLHKAEFEHNQVKTMDAATYAQTQIPIGVAWFSGAVSFLFFCLCLVVLRVLGQRSRQLAERSRLYNEAQKAILSRDEVIAAVSYDFVEPLAMIAQAARADSDDSCEVIQSAVGVIEDRVRDIADQTKADAGILSLRLEQLALDAILDEAKLMMQPLAKQKEIRLDFTPVNPPVLAFFDTERVLRVLTNLVGNAIKFSPKFSKVTIKVRSDQQYVYVSVKDGGTGISEKQLPIIFDNFWQARKTSDQGAGVGLAVVKTVVTAHGGIVTAESHSNGSTFTFSLPRRRPVGFHQRAAAAPVVKIAPRSTDMGL